MESETLQPIFSSDTLNRTYSSQSRHNLVTFEPDAHSRSSKDGASSDISSSVSFLAHSSTYEAHETQRSFSLLSYIANFLVVWIVPTFGICVVSAVVSAFVAAAIYVSLYFMKIPAKVKTFPVFFNYLPYEPKSLPYPAEYMASICNIQDCEQFRGFRFCRNSLKVGDFACDSSGMEKKEKETGESDSQSLHDIGICKKTFFGGADSEAMHGQCEDVKENKKFTKSIPGLDDAHTRKIKDSYVNDQHDVAVAYVPFDGESWEPFYDRDATNRGTLGSKTLNHPIHFLLELNYAPPHHFLPPLPPGYIHWRNFHPSPAPIMVTLEVFRNDSSLLGRSTRPFIPQLKSNTWFLFSSLPVPFGLLGHRSEVVSTQIRLLELFDFKPAAHIALARLQIQPSLTVMKSTLALEIDLIGVRRLVRDYPVTAFVIFLLIFTLLFGTFMTTLCFGMYFYLVQKFHKPLS